MAGGEVQPSNFISPPRGKGRGRGRGFSAVKDGPELPLVRGVNSDSPPRSGLGRGRRLFQAAMATESHTNGSDTMQQEMAELERWKKEQERLVAEKELDEVSKLKKRVRKLKKMLRQVRL